MQGGGQGTILPSGPPVHVFTQGSTFLHQTIGVNSCAMKGADVAQNSRTPPSGTRLRWYTTEFNLFSDNSLEVCEVG